MASDDDLIEHPDLTWFRERPRETTILQLSKPLAPVLGSCSRLGGFPFLPEGEPWPVCEKCEVPLFFVGQFGRDLPQLPLPNGCDLLCIYKCTNYDCDDWMLFTGPPYFHLYNTAECFPIQQPDAAWDSSGVYIPPELDENDVIDFGEEAGFPYEIALGETLIEYPRIDEFDSYREIDGSIRDPYSKRYPRSGTKLLGHPRWLQAPRYPNCRCERVMVQLLQLDYPHVQLGDAGRMHVMYCPVWCSGVESLVAEWDCH